MIVITKTKRVSVVLPVYNGSKYLRQSIESCLNQTYKNIELVIVDDGSTDDSEKTIKSFKDKRIKYFKHKKNRGLPTSLNTGFAHTTGEYLTWTSDDNYYVPEAIESMVFELEDNKCPIVYTDYLEVKDDKTSLIRMSGNQDFTKGNQVGPCFLYTRKVMKTVGKFNPQFEGAEDYDWWIRASKQFKMWHIPVPLYYYRRHKDSISIRKHYEVVITGALVNVHRGFPIEIAIENIVYLIGRDKPFFPLSVRLNRVVARMKYSDKIWKILNDYRLKLTDVIRAKELLKTLIMGAVS